MSKERPDERAVAGDSLQLVVNAALQFFSCPQRRARHARAFGMAPYKLVRVQVWRITRQKMQREFARRAGDVLLDQGLFVRGQSIDHQAHRFFAPMHQLSSYHSIFSSTV